MSKKNPDIASRLRAMPNIMVRRAPGVLFTGIAVSVLILILWVLLLVNTSDLSQQFASQQEGAVTLNQRVGSRFGVVIGAVALPLLAVLPLTLSWFFSKRFYHRHTGTRVLREYRGIFAGTAQQGDEFQQLLRTRDASIIGPMNLGAERGNLIIEGWVAASDRVAYVGVYAFDLRQDPHWEIVEFSGTHFDDYGQIFSQKTRPDPQP